MNIIKELKSKWNEKKLFRQLKDDTKNTISYKLGGMVYTLKLQEFAKKCLVKGIILGVSFMGVVFLLGIIAVLAIPLAIKLTVITVVGIGLGVAYISIINKLPEDEADKCK